MVLLCLVETSVFLSAARPCGGASTSSQLTLTPDRDTQLSGLAYGLPHNPLDYGVKVTVKVYIPAVMGGANSSVATGLSPALTSTK